MTKEDVAFQAMAEYAARLGLPSRDVLASDSMMRGFYPQDQNQNHHYDGLASSYVYIKTKGRSVRYIKHTVAHELIHYAFVRDHGSDFERYIKALQDGNMFFTGQFRKTNYTLFNGNLTKIDILVTGCKKPKPEASKVVNEIDGRIKRFRTKIKALTTRLRKLERKRNYLLKKRGGSKP